MWGTPRQRLLACTALLAVLAAAPASAADVKAARVWASPGSTRVVFDLSGPLSYTLSQQTGKVVLSLARSAASDFDIPGAQGLYKGLTSDRQGGTLRLIAKVDPASRPRSFLLKPSGDYGYRLVLDLLPGTAGQPAMATGDGSDDTSVAVAPVAAVPSGKASRRGSTLSSRQAAILLQGQRKIVVAVDAGHGGKDPGSHGPGGTLEKNITLSVARQLAAQINDQPGMQAILTRDSDVFIPLQQRYEIAREHNADMFVSIHADAYASSDARGSSVWVLSPRGKTSEAARWLADRENHADLIGGVSLDDKDNNLAAVLLDLQQGYAMQASESIADSVLKALGKLGPTHRGYVESANFVVLRSPDVPSMLVETAFISNPTEERKLRDPDHQAALASAVMGGIRNYFEATPPPGSWFAAEAARRSGVNLVADVDDADPVPVKPAAARPTLKASAKAAPMIASAGATGRVDADVRDLHRVGRGESLSSIARDYGVSVSALKGANNLSADSVHVGTVLAIPSG